MGPAFNLNQTLYEINLTFVKPFEIVPHQKCTLNLHLICIKKVPIGQ